ncbi:MAG: protein kinase domain-containing protein [Pyrinomonadaceae bacterium]
MVTPAQLLAGKTLDGGWVVGNMIIRPPDATGGHFSCSYNVQSKDGMPAFLKAMDYSAALNSPDPATELQAMTKAYNFERDIVMKCRNRHLDRVVRAITSGKFHISESGVNGPVEYLIFEQADKDIRGQLDMLQSFNLAWVLRSLHQMATGLKQLHGEGIAHQDLKPSNVLVFDSKVSKLADLGCASDKAADSPRDILNVPGDYGYAPPELLYKYRATDWHERRVAPDLYHLGSMVVFMFTTSSMTGLLLSEMSPAHHWKVWTGTFADVAPYIREAFGRALEKIENDLPSHPDLRKELMLIISRLCDPDPQYRGHPKNGAKSYSLERYVNWFNLLAYRAGIGTYN